MPVKKKTRKRAANKTRRTDPVAKKTRVIEEEYLNELKYARIMKKLGNDRYTVVSMENKEYLAKIRGSLRKFTRLDVDDVVIISLREFDERKVDICHKYSFDDVLYLESKGFLVWKKEETVSRDTPQDTQGGVLFQQKEVEDIDGEGLVDEELIDIDTI